jgi:gas vesicle protein
MAQEPDRLRQDIENTRSSLTRDVDLLAEKTSPGKVAQRRWTAVKEKVMGSPNYGSHTGGTSVKDKASDVRDKAADKASDVKDRASDAVGTVKDKAGDTAHSVADSVRSAPQTVTQQAQGNPLATGLIAFGVGLLAATLIPVTDAERRAGQQLKDHSGDLTDQVKGAAAELKDDLSGTVQEAAGQVKETAQDAAAQVKGTAQDAGQNAAQAARSSS